MGCILFLTKHHDGFCLWDTKTTDRKSTKAPLGRDVLAGLRKVGRMIRNPPPMPLSLEKAVTASSLWDPGYEADKVVDGRDTSRWSAPPDARSGWIQVDLGSETEVGRARIMEIGYRRTEKFAIEYTDGDS